MRPLDVRKSAVGGEFKYHVSGLEVRHDGAVVLGRGSDKVGVAEAPVDGQDTCLVQVLESGHWVLRVPQIPNVEAGVLVVVRSNDKLGGNQGVPLDLGLDNRTLGCVVIRPCVEVVVVCAGGLGLRLGKLEDALGLLEVPDHNLTVFGGRSQNVGDNTVPAD